MGSPGHHNSTRLNAVDLQPIAAAITNLIAALKASTPDRNIRISAFGYSDETGKIEVETEDVFVVADFEGAEIKVRDRWKRDA